jgi:hypothetical protein
MKNAASSAVKPTGSAVAPKGDGVLLSYGKRLFSIITFAAAAGCGSDSGVNAAAPEKITANYTVPGFVGATPVAISDIFSQVQQTARANTATVAPGAPNNPVTCTLQLGADGKYTLYVNSDAAQNKGTCDLNATTGAGNPLDVTIHANEAPNDIPNINAVQNADSSQAVTFTARNGFDYQYQVDGSAWTAITGSTFTVAAGLPAGTYTLTVQEKNPTSGQSQNSSSVLEVKPTCPPGMTYYPGLGCA